MTHEFWSHPSTAPHHPPRLRPNNHRRSGPPFQRARELIREGRLGQIVAADNNNSRNVSPGFGNPPDGPPPPELDYDLFLGPAPKRPYHPNNIVAGILGVKGHPVGGPQLEPEEKGQLWTTPEQDQSGDAIKDCARHTRNFLDCVKWRQQPLSDLESGHQVATACHLSNISA